MAQPWAYMQPLTPDGRPLPLVKPEHAFGRGEIGSARKAVSKQHLLISSGGPSGVTLTDTSVNGTFCNGVRLRRDAPQALHHGDLITLVAPDAPEGFMFIVARRMRSPVLLGQRARSVEVQASEADAGPETYVALLRKLMTASLRRPRGSPAVTDTPAAARPSSPMDGPTPVS